jgi:hypothetical protein
MTAEFLQRIDPQNELVTTARDDAIYWTAVAFSRQSPGGAHHAINVGTM